MAAGILALVVAIVLLAGAATTVERTARQRPGWFGAFIFLGLAGLLAAGLGLHELGALQ